MLPAAMEGVLSEDARVSTVNSEARRGSAAAAAAAPLRNLLLPILFVGLGSDLSEAASSLLTEPVVDKLDARERGLRSRRETADVELDVTGKCCCSGAAIGVGVGEDARDDT